MILRVYAFCMIRLCHTCEKASKVNVILKKNLPSKIELIDHSSITEGHLNGSGLHLNQRGDGALAFNLIKHIREIER